MENEENRGLINKKDYEDELVPFVSLVLELSLYSLSLKHNLGHLDFSWTTLALDKKRKRRHRGRKDQARKSRIKQPHQVYLQVSICMCDFLVKFGMHDYACVLLVFLL